MRSVRNMLGNEAGFAMAGLMLVMLVLLAFGSFTVLNTALNQRATSHYDTANRAFFAAESGVMHALSTMNGPGVIDFQSDIVNRWNTLYGASTKSMSMDPRAEYTVSVQADATAPSSRGTITVTGKGPLRSKRVIRVAVAKGGFEGTPGAIHIAADANVDAEFRGNNFRVDGRNYNVANQLLNDILKPGISTRSDAVNNEVINSLNSAQKDNVKGLGFSSDPLTPSVMKTGGPGVGDLDQFVADLLARPGVVTTNTKNFNGNDVFGTLAAPQITYMTDPDVTLNGNASGAGILIADGSVTINGSLNFTGLIIVRGDTVIDYSTDPDGTVLLGNATIKGSLWTGNLEITVGGSASIKYCHECLQLVDNVGGTANAIPRPMTVVSWGEVL